MTEEITDVNIDVNTDDVEPPHDDVITLERKIGATRASVTLMSTTVVTGAWAAGDSQALRRLVEALMEVADGATARVDRAARLIDDLTTGTRIVRDQLRTALDDIDHLRTKHEATEVRNAARVGELLAEVTRLTAELAVQQVTPTMTADAAKVLTENRFTDTNRLLAERDEARRDLQVEKRRADAAVAEMRSIADVKAINAGEIRLKAMDAAFAADEAFEEAKWKEGGRYLKLANMWIALLGAVTWQEILPKESE